MPLSAEVNRLVRVYRVSSLVVLRGRFDGGLIGWTAFREAWQAELDRMTVVTHERPGATKTVKIPDACAALGVRFVDTFAMLPRCLAATTFPGYSATSTSTAVHGQKRSVCSSMKRSSPISLR